MTLITEMDHKKINNSIVDDAKQRNTEKHKSGRKLWALCLDC